MIPADWVYEDDYPVACLSEVGRFVQVSCPSCDQGKGYQELAILKDYKKEVVECSTCKTKFIALV